MVKKGDTLIEVTIAIGIFSMIAIGVASVMSSGSSGSQTALETTLAREEIDVQAEALRFIHSARISNQSNTTNSYNEIWQRITENAIKGDELEESIAQFAPETCQALYNENTLASQHAFILNPKALASGDDAVFLASDATGAAKFAATSTYPRLIYGSSADDSGSLIAPDGTELFRAEGIYIVPVRDSGTNIVGYDDAQAAFYDFYIRTCWYGTDNERPSTISTVIRLYDPPTIESHTTIPDIGEGEIHIYYCDNPDYPGKCAITGKTGDACNDSGLGTCDDQIIDRTGDDLIKNLEAIENHVRFKHWQDTVNSINRRTNPSTNQIITESQAENSSTPKWVFLADWDTESNKITYDSNGGSKFSNNQTTITKECKAFESCDLADKKGFTFTIDTSLQPTRDGYDFLGWANSATATSPTHAMGKTHKVNGRSITLYAVWRPRYMQDLTVQACQSKASSSDLTVFDRRDNRLYKVRYSQNKCWMVDDLRIGANTNGVVTPTDSNFTRNNNLKMTNSSMESYWDPVFGYYRFPDDSTAYLYNFCAASAGTGNGCTKDTQYTGNQDICPANWRMPTATEAWAASSTSSNVFRRTDTGYWWTSTDEIGSGEVGRLMCLLFKFEKGFSFSGEYLKTSCTQKDPGTNLMSGYRRNYFIKIRCIHR